ncbi:neutral zinc metallopeptidase [Nocardia goodfellowii]|uniref:Metalloprotease n=1 Tax=Nocardia goodfellowii TaxID=882446 RepID=A0ABS4QJ71_9NOCA|nr:neutral zinc metallopeptidase [Nocardia goodfellowii]MBP2191757.1 putative metalloprotease [Nocardia goodfellowii]
MVVAVITLVVGAVVIVATNQDGDGRRAASPETSNSSTFSTPSKPATLQLRPGPIEALGDHPLLNDTAAGLRNFSCDWLPWGTSREAVTRFLDRAALCMDQSWRHALTDKKIAFSSPNLSVPATAASATGPCINGDESNWAAFYCSANNTIYMPMDTIQIQRYGNDATIYLALLAHEYGHHIQAISGISIKAHKDMSSAGSDSAAGLELSRRLELQAQCFAGMFLGATQHTGAIAADAGWRAIKDSYSRGAHPGQARDHGSPQNYGWWAEHGYTTNRLAECNTWNAAPASVS